MNSLKKDEESYQLVESKRHFNPEESPVFHILNEQNAVIQNLKINHPSLTEMEPFDQEGRRSLLLHQKCESVYFPIFRGFKRTKQHLRADLILVDLITHEKLDPFHASVYYLNAMTQQIICVHVFYNMMGI